MNVFREPAYGGLPHATRPRRTRSFAPTRPVLVTRAPTVGRPEPTAPIRTADESDSGVDGAQNGGL